MSTTEQILVVFLSTALAIFLVIAIIAGIYAIRLLKTINRVAEKAEGFVDSAEAVGDMVRQTVGAMSITRMVKGIINFVHHKQSEGKNKGSDK
jgi:hypothetical protein